MRPALALVLTLAAFAASAQQLYRWTDESGRTHVTDSPPPANAKSVQKKSGPASTPGAAASGSTPAEPFAVQQARQNYPVTLFSTPGCEACDQARKLLNTRGVPFKEISVNDDASLAELKKAVGSNSVPSLLVGASVFKGFEEGAVQRLLDVAGYPKTGILPARSQGEPAPPGEQKTEVTPVAPEAARGPYAPKPPRPAPPSKGAAQ